MFVVDASVWVASYRTQDQHHFESQQWIREVMTRGDTILGPAILLAEVAGALALLSGDTSGALATVENIRRFPTFELAVDSKELADLSARLLPNCGSGARTLYTLPSPSNEASRYSTTSNATGRVNGCGRLRRRARVHSRPGVIAGLNLPVAEARSNIIAKSWI